MKNNMLTPKTKEEDVYGQVHPIETSGVVSEKLAAFQEELDKIPRHEKEDVCAAEVKCPELLTNDFKLMFLRCEVFNVDRYITYWEKRVDLFGPEKAFQPLTQDAALRDDAAALHNGFLRLVGTKGVGGRHIVFCDSGLQDFSLSRDSVMRAFWYLFHIMLEDEDTQKRGIVFICDLFGSSLGKCDLKIYRGMANYAQGCLPIRISGIHFVHPPLRFSLFFSIIKIALGKRLRKRVKVHSGRDSRVRAELAKNGLYQDVIPVETGGQVVLGQRKWLQDLCRQGK